MESLWIAKTGLDAQQTRMSVVSNNLANVNTMGFKRGRPVFEDLLYQNVAQAGTLTSQATQNPTGMNLGTGVRIVGTEKNFAQGSTVQTGNELDVAVNGRGFFQVLLPDGQLAFSRDGSFKIDATGRLVTAAGFEIQPAISVPTGVQSISIGEDGVVQADIAGSPAPVTRGNIPIADFINPAGLQAEGQNLYI
ncbi:MAG: flagellar hook-basal body complex protein, partial [Gammaproteobacteria bacterium]